DSPGGQRVVRRVGQDVQPADPREWPGAGISLEVGVRVLLAGVGGRGTVVAGVPDTVPIGVGLIRVGFVRADVARVGDTVAVPIVVARVASTVTVGVALRGVGDQRTIVAGVAGAFPVGVRPPRVGDR